MRHFLLKTKSRKYGIYPQSERRVNVKRKKTTHRVPSAISRVHLYAVHTKSCSISPAQRESQVMTRLFSTAHHFFEVFALFSRSLLPPPCRLCMLVRSIFMHSCARQLRAIENSSACDVSQGWWMLAANGERIAKRWRRREENASAV